jgi:HlyD family secretion protein
MSRRSVVSIVVVAALVVATGVGLYTKSASATTPGVIAAAGDVRVDESVVRAPAITYPTPNTTAAIATTASTNHITSVSTGSSSRLPVVSGYLTHVLVAEGDHVTKGQVVAQLDTTMLDLGVQAAKAASRKAHASLDVIDANLDKLTTTRAKLVKTRAKLVKTRGSLEATIAVLNKRRGSLETSIALIKQIIAQPGGPPPHVPPYPALLQALQQGLAKLKAGIASAKTGLATLDSGLAKISTGIAKIDSGRTQLRNARKLLVISAKAKDVAVSVATTRRDQTTIVAPVGGVVTYTRAAGTAAMVGAPIVRIRPDGPTHIYTYLTSDQLAQVSVGSRATVTFDSNPGSPLTGHLSYLGDSAVVPPTSFPTSIVHMTRAVRVTVELDDGQVAPPGTPVDIEISTNR